jgi:type IV secretion system protein VirB9
MKWGVVVAVLGIALAACASTEAIKPEIAHQVPVRAQRLPEPTKPVEVVAIPQPLPLPGQLERIEQPTAKPAEPADPGERVDKANEAARVVPTQDGYLNAIQVWPYSDGALYQVYTSPSRVTDIALQEGEELIAVSAGDTVRWIVGDTTSASGADKRVHILVKPVRADLKTNLVITTNRRLYLLELTSTEKNWMASISWDYPRDRLLLLQRQAQQADKVMPVADGITLEKLAFRYQISGDAPSWRPLRAFDDGEHVYIQFPVGIAQGELPPLFVVGTAGKAELVNYRYRAPYYVVDRLFAVAELRLGADIPQVVKISRSDEVKQ